MVSCTVTGKILCYPLLNSRPESKLLIMPAAETMVLFPPLPDEEARAFAEAGGDTLTVVNAANEEAAPT